MAAARLDPTKRHVKLSVTIPWPLAQRLEESVAAGEAPSISALVTRALERELTSELDELDQLFQEWIESGQVVVTEQDREWARQVLAR